jgi:molybdopterin-containing oxidoreductase family iron-sulfur binding subunit
VHLGRYDDETAGRCHWHIPELHWLESWSDGRAYDGTVSVIQPLIAPLYGGKSAHDVLVGLSDKPDRTARDLVRSSSVPGMSGDRAELAFRRALHDGVAAAGKPAVAPPAAKPRSLPRPTARASRSCFVPIPRFTTGATRATAGCRSCRGR